MHDILGAKPRSGIRHFCPHSSGGPNVTANRAGKGSPVFPGRGNGITEHLGNLRHIKKLKIRKDAKGYAGQMLTRRKLE